VQRACRPAVRRKLPEGFGEKRRIERALCQIGSPNRLFLRVRATGTRMLLCDPDSLRMAKRQVYGFALTTNMAATFGLIAAMEMSPVVDVVVVRAQTFLMV